MLLPLLCYPLSLATQVCNEGDFPVAKESVKTAAKLYLSLTRHMKCYQPRLFRKIQTQMTGVLATVPSSSLHPFGC